MLHFPKRISILLFLISTVSSLQAQPQISAAPQDLAPQAPTAQPPKEGITLTPLPVEENDLNAILGIEMWRFKLQVPDPQTQLRFRLELRQPNKATIIMRNWGMATSQNMESIEVTLALMPQPMGEGLTSASQLLIYSKFQNLNPDGTKSGATSGRGTSDNPLKNLGVIGYSPKSSTTPDGSRVLMEFQTDTQKPPTICQLVLALTATPKTK